METYNELMIVHKQLSCKLLRLQTELALCQNSLKKDQKPKSAEELGALIKETEHKLRERISVSSNQENVVKMYKIVWLKYGEQSFDAIYHKELASSGDKDVHDKLEMCATKLSALANTNCQLQSKLELLDSLQKRLIEQQKDLQAILWKNRDLCTLVDRAKENTNGSGESAPDTETRQLSDDVDSIARECSMRKSCLQSLIHASQVDWFADPELLELMISLGEPTSS